VSDVDGVIRPGQIPAVDYTIKQGIDVLDSTPTGGGGDILLDNDTALLNGWFPLTATTHFSTTAPSTSTITMAVDFTAWAFVGRPVKYTCNAVTGYGILTTSAAGLWTIAGSPLNTGAGLLTALWIGHSRKVHIVERHIAGEYADAANTTLLATDAKFPLLWRLPASFLVHFAAYTDTADNTPDINVQIEGAYVSTSNGNDGLTMAVAQTWYDTVVDINPTNYPIEVGHIVDITTTQGAGADDLTVFMTFVEA